METRTSRIFLTGWVLPVIALGFFALPIFAQNGGPGGYDPSAYRQRMTDMLKERLNATDEEMQALGPKIEKIYMMQREMNMGMRMMMFRGQGGPGGQGGQGGPNGQGAPAGQGGPQNDQQASPFMTAVRDLQTTLDNKDAKPEEIKAKLQAFRDAKAQNKAEITKAQGELRDLLTQRQEATLAMMGILD